MTEEAKQSEAVESDKADSAAAGAPAFEVVLARAAASFWKPPA